MAWKGRLDSQRRLAGAKAALPDEFLTRSQLVPGDNVTFDYLPNLDIRINALVTGGGRGSNIRFLKAPIRFGYIPWSGKDKTYNDTAHNLIKRTYNDVHHNWQLSNRSHLLWCIYEHTTGASLATRVADTIRIVPINQNTIRVWFPQENAPGNFYSDGTAIPATLLEAAYRTSMGNPTVQSATNLVGPRAAIPSAPTQLYYIVLMEAA